ncbi:MAG: C4-dicarboxylate TRAP transporter substrate-binding protein [Lachnospiraceae bacterium]|nr:C4-dicarboxylate TRAP transporter substrate-binding protein [Lachnospiraceae bacterium]
MKRAKKVVSLVVATAMTLSLGAPVMAGAEETITINVGYENATTEPAAIAVEKWAELVEEASGGTIQMELFPNSALGTKSNLIDQMVMGENVITVADGAFLADYGVPDFGIFYAPFAFDSWDEEWAVIESDWYADLCDQLASTAGIRVLSSNWVYGSRDMMSIKEVILPEDLSGLKLRVSSNDLSITSFTDLGASALGMDMGDVYQALQAGTIDAVENPVVSLANRSFQEVAKYVVRTGHILAVSMWICSDSFFQSLTEEQQQILVDCANEAGLYNNEIQDEAEAEALTTLEDAGVQITDLTDEQKQVWIDAAQYFYENDTDSLGWTEGLYDTIKAAAAEVLAAEE